MAAVVGLSSVVNERPFPLNPPPDSGNGIPSASLHSAFSRCCILTPSGHWTPAWPWNAGWRTWKRVLEDKVAFRPLNLCVCVWVCMRACVCAVGYCFRCIQLFIIPNRLAEIRKRDYTTFSLLLRQCPWPGDSLRGPWGPGFPWQYLCGLRRYQISEVNVWDQSGNSLVQ